MKRATALLPLLFLGACTVGPNYVKPDVATPQAFSSAAQPGSDGAPLSVVTPDQADMTQWWAVFNDPQLAALVKRALAGNLQLQEAVSRVKEARAQLTVARAAELPSVSADGVGARMNRNADSNGFNDLFSGLAGQSSSASAAGAGAAAASSQANGPNHIDILSVGLDATWQLDVFGGGRRSIEAAKASAAQAVWQARDTQVSIAAEVASDYLQLRMTQARLANTLVDLQRQEGLFKIIRDRFNAGFVTNLDVDQQRTQLAQSRAQVPAYNAQITSYIHAIGVLLGEQPEAVEAELAPSKPIPPVPPKLPGGLPSDLLRRRPDIRAAERSLASANAQIGVQVAKFYPSFNLIGQGGFAADSPSKLFDLKNASSLGLLDVSWNVFNAGSTAAQVRSAKAAREVAFFEYRRTVITALQESEDALSKYAADQARWTALTASFAAANSAFTIATQQYQAGITDFTAVYQAQGTLLNLQDQVTQADAQLAADVVSLYKALGGGWTDQPGKA